MEQTKSKKIKKIKLNNPVLEAILEYVDDFNLKFAETKDTFKKARLSTSDRKEECIKDFFLSIFPDGYDIKRGEIFDYDNISNSIDCVILSPNHPKLKTPMRPNIIIAEGVYAAIEVKPDISILTQKGELYRGLKQCKSVKKLNRNFSKSSIDKLDFNGNYKKIPFIIFSKKSKDVETTLDFIIKQIENGTLKKEEIPDIIFSLDGWLIYHTNNIATSLFKPTFELELKEKTENRDAFMLFKSESSYLICILILLLHSFIAPNNINDDFIIRNYLLKMYKENKIPFTRAICFNLTDLGSST